MWLVVGGPDTGRMQTWWALNLPEAVGVEMPGSPRQPEMWPRFQEKGISVRPKSSLPSAAIMEHLLFARG